MQTSTFPAVRALDQLLDGLGSGAARRRQLAMVRGELERALARGALPVAARRSLRRLLEEEALRPYVRLAESGALRHRRVDGGFPPTSQATNEIRRRCLDLLREALGLPALQLGGGALPLQPTPRFGDLAALRRQLGVHARNTIGTFRGQVDHSDLVSKRVIRPSPGLSGLLRLQPGVERGADHAQTTAQQDHRVDGLLRSDEPVDLAHRSLSLAKKAAAFFKISIVFCCSVFCLRSRFSSSRSALVSSPDVPPPWSTRSRFTQPRRLSGLTPRSRATSVIVLSEERANAIASRLNSSECRLEY
nr:hypothetical protein [Streptomyces sp. NEAU-383]